MDCIILEALRSSHAIYRLQKIYFCLRLQKDKIINEIDFSQSDLSKSWINISKFSNFSLPNRHIRADLFSSVKQNFSFSDLFSRFLRVLNKNRRFFFLEKIVNNFFDLLLNEKGEVLATLKLSHTISDSDKADIAKKLDNILKKKINISFSVDPSLLVGSILQIGSTMIDTSAKTRLNNLLNK